MRQSHQADDTTGAAASDSVGVLIRRPRLYAASTILGFRGRRRRLYDSLLQQSGVGAGDDLLDVGCGPGYLVRRAARLVGPRGSVRGVDPSPEVIAYARAHARRNTGFTEASATDLPYPDSRWDVVTCTLALHHLPAEHRSRAVDEMYRVLRPGGVVLLADFRPGHGPRDPQLPRDLLHRLLGRPVRHGDGKPLVDLLVAAGFSIRSRADHPHRMQSVAAVRPSR